LVIDDFDGSSNGDQIITVRSKAIDISTLTHTALSYFKGSLAEWREIISTDVRKIPLDALRTDKYLCLIQLGKKKFQIVVYPTSYSNLRIFENRNSTSGSGGSGGNSGNNAQALVMMGGAPSKQYLNTEPVVNIESPKSGDELDYNDKHFFSKHFEYYKLGENETVQAAVEKITGKPDLSAIQEVNYQSYNPGDIVYPGALLKIENGLELEIKGNVLNSESVVITVTGAINGNETRDLGKAGVNQEVSWIIYIQATGSGAVKIEAKAASASGQAEALSEPIIKKPNWVEVVYTENGTPIGIELDYIITFDDGTKIRAKLKNGTDYISMVPLLPFTIEFLPTKEKQKELDELYKKLDKELKDKVTEVEKKSAQLKKEWEAHPWYMKRIVGKLYDIKGAAYWVADTIESAWTLVKGAVVGAAETTAWITEYQLHKEKLLVYIFTSNKEGITEETAHLERMSKEVNGDITETVETAKTLYYLAHDDRIGTRLKEFIENYFTALSPQEQHEFVTRYGIDIILIFVGGSGAAILGVKNAAKISQYLSKMSEILKVFKYKFKPNTKGTVNEKNTYDKVIKPRKMKQHTPSCFKPGSNVVKSPSYSGNSKKLNKDFYKQLKGQEDGLNKMTVGEYVERRNSYKEIGRGNGAAQRQARKDLEITIARSIEEKLIFKGESRVTAKIMSKEQAGKQMKNLAALHNPDLVSGGKDEIHKLGNKNVNSSIGSQWRDRVSSMDEAADKTLQTNGANAKMNVKLDVCK